MSDNGDERLVNAGIVLPCAKVFGFVSSVFRCDRPYGHTGPHTASGTSMSGRRDGEDEARTVFVLTQILKGERP